jgi:hypothetical protein
MGEDIKYVLRDIASIRLLSSTNEYIITYTNGKSDYTRSTILLDKSKLPMLVLVEYKRICNEYRFVGLTKVKEFNSKGHSIKLSEKLSEKLENKLSFGGPLMSPGKADKILDERIR